MDLSTDGGKILGTNTENELLHIHNDGDTNCGVWELHLVAENPDKDLQNNAKQSSTLSLSLYYRGNVNYAHGSHGNNTRPTSTPSGSEGKGTR